MGGPMMTCDIKLVNWEEANYRVTDKPNPRGEIHISGPTVSQGYYKQPEKTKEDFYVDEEGVRWFKTGDIGEFSSLGNLEVNSCIICNISIGADGHTFRLSTAKKTWSNCKTANTLH